jgi:hypothetical protein
MNGLTAIYVRSDSLNSQIGVILGAEAVGAGMGPQKELYIHAVLLHYT